MRHEPNYGLQVERRIFTFRENARLDMQALRNKWLTELDDLFDTANAIAKGKVGQQKVGDKLQHITPKERQMWAQIASNVGMVMSSLSKGYDERQFNQDITELEKQIEEWKAFQAEHIEEWKAIQAESIQKKGSTAVAKPENTNVSKSDS
jgi:cell division protein FtsL